MLKNVTLLVILAVFYGCEPNKNPPNTPASALTEKSQQAPAKQHFKDAPLVSHLYTADPSAHVFEGKLFIYPSHDIDNDAPPGLAGEEFVMEDYHVFSMDTVGGPVTDHGPALHVGEVPWASQQMWAPDAAKKGDRYYLYFPAKDQHGIFRIGVATSNKPQGPFKPLSQAIEGTYSIDPAVFKDDDGSYYLYLGGILGGQLQHWQSGKYSEQTTYPAKDSPTLLPRMAKLKDNMTSLAHPLTAISLLDEEGNLINFGDKRMFFEAPWVHKHQGNYYLSWSTGNNQTIEYATSDSPYGPFTWQGRVLEAVQGWTNHHSIVKYQGNWWLFYHDTQLSGIKHLRNMKMSELQRREDGSIETIDALLAE